MSTLADFLISLDQQMVQTLAPATQFIDASPEERNPLTLVPILNNVRELIRYLQNEVRGAIPHVTYSDYLRDAIAAQDRLTALYNGLANPDQAGGSLVVATYARLDSGQNAAVISEEQVYSMSFMGYTDAAIARQFGVSRSTISRRRNEWNMTKQTLQSLVPDEAMVAVSYSNLEILSSRGRLMCACFSQGRQPMYGHG